MKMWLFTFFFLFNGAYAESFVSSSSCDGLGGIDREFNQAFPAAMLNSLSVSGLDGAWNFRYRPELLQDEERTMYEKLGFVLGPRKSGWGDPVPGVQFVQQPTWFEFVSRYHATSDSLGISNENRIRPGLALVRTTGPMKEYRIIDPTSELFFKYKRDGWAVHYGRDGFNLPGDVIIEGLRNGLFPLLDRGHDVGHFISFLRFPDSAAALKLAFVDIRPEHVTPAFRRRLFLVLEMGTFVERRFKEKIHSFLAQKRKVQGNEEVPALKQGLAQMQSSHLAKYGTELAALLRNSISQFGGSLGTPSERVSVLGWLETGQVLDFFTDLQKGMAFDAQSSRIGSLLHGIYFNNQAPPQAFPTKTVNDVLVFNFYSLAFGLQVASEQALGVGAAASPTQLNQLRDFIAAAEYTLIRSTRDLTPQAWIQGLLRPQLSVDAPVVQVLKDVFPNQRFRRLYLEN